MTSVSVGAEGIRERQTLAWPRVLSPEQVSSVTAFFVPSVEHVIEEKPTSVR